MAELVTGPYGATVDGVLHLGTDGHLAIPYEVRTTRTSSGLRYDVRTPDGEELSWTAPITPEARRTLILGGAPLSASPTEAEPPPSPTQTQRGT